MSDVSHFQQPFTHFGQDWVLVDKALYWPAHKMLLVADVHVGKATHFRKAGIAVPVEVEDVNLMRLTRLIADLTIEQVIFMGDLFHSDANVANIHFEHWLSGFDGIRFSLVEGNHDVHNTRIPKRLDCQSALEIEGITLVHEPLEGDAVHICGHIHPSVMMRGKGKQRLRLPAAILSERQMILPAFGEFTGTYTVEMKEGMRAVICQ